MPPAVLEQVIAVAILEACQQKPPEFFGDQPLEARPLAARRPGKGDLEVDQRRAALVVHQDAAVGVEGCTTIRQHAGAPCRERVEGARFRGHGTPTGRQGDVEASERNADTPGKESGLDVCRDLLVSIVCILLIIATFAVYNELELAKYEPELIYVDSQNRITRRGHKIPVQAAA